MLNENTKYDNIKSILYRGKLWVVDKTAQDRGFYSSSIEPSGYATTILGAAMIMN
jgi:hypothetical protein